MPTFAFPNEETPRFLFERPDLVAQLVEQYTFNVWVLGSNPSRITSYFFYLRPGSSGLFYFPGCATHLCYLYCFT